MKQMKSWLLLAAGSTLLFATGLIFTSCSTPADKGTPSPEPNPAVKSPAAKPAASTLGGAQLWSQNCGHCHNTRSPNSYSDAQWEVVMLHMRVRANLTAAEEKQILPFLKSAH